MRKKSRDWIRCPALIELACVYLLILFYIWRLRDGQSWLPILAVIIGSHLVYREGPQKLGFWPVNFKKVFVDTLNSEKVLWLVCVALPLVFIMPWREMTWRHALGNLGKDCLFGLVQQYLLCGYVTNRLITCNSGDQERANIVWAGAVLFSLAHLPNMFLMFATAVGGCAAIKIFLRYRNLWFLALAHGLVKFCLFLVTTDGWPAYGFKIGPRI